MARVVNLEENAARRNQILDVVQSLIYAKGYEAITIQDVLNGVQMSKGAFYHYFDSKQDLLEALIERMMMEVEQILLPVVHDPHLSALDKFQRYFDTVGRWKTAQKSFLLALLRVWYTDENAIVRQKVTREGLKQIVPLLAIIIRQGVHEGVFSTSYPDLIGEVVLSIMLGLSESIAGNLLSFEPNLGTLERIENAVAAYTDALECVLRTKPGSLSLIDGVTLREWVIPTENSAIPILT